MSTFDIAQQFQEKEGWDDETIRILALELIDQMKGTAGFETFLQWVADNSDTYCPKCGCMWETHNADGGCCG